MLVDKKYLIGSNGTNQAKAGLVFNPVPCWRVHGTDLRQIDIDVVAPGENCFFTKVRDGAASAGSRIGGHVDAAGSLQGKDSHAAGGKGAHAIMDGFKVDALGVLISGDVKPDLLPQWKTALP